MRATVSAAGGSARDAILAVSSGIRFTDALLSLRRLRILRRRLPPPLELDMLVSLVITLGSRSRTTLTGASVMLVARLRENSALNLSLARFRSPEPSTRI